MGHSWLDVQPHHLTKFGDQKKNTQNCSLLIGNNHLSLTVVCLFLVLDEGQHVCIFIAQQSLIFTHVF